MNSARHALSFLTAGPDRSLKNLAHLSDRTIWAPAIFSIEDFVMEYCGLTPADPVTLLFELYAVHPEVAGEQHKEFEEFADIGPLILKDFNETDLYLADPDRLFNFLSEAKAIATWNPDGRPLTKFQQDYLAFDE